jgi:ubiquinone/menaquinone biosynthesis C-methylase UbiE
MPLPGGTALLNQEKILRREIGLGFGEKVGDFGCGHGFFTFPAARLVGEKGRVYAVDILKSALKIIEKHAQAAGLTNIIPVWSNLEIYGATAIPPHSLDTALVISLLFQNKKRAEILGEIDRLVKREGKIAIIDWQRETPFGPPKKIMIPPEKVEELAQKLAWQKIKSFEAGPYHYGLIFQKQK